MLDDFFEDSCFVFISVTMPEIFKVENWLNAITLASSTLYKPGMHLLEKNHSP